MSTGIQSIDVRYSDTRTIRTHRNFKNRVAMHSLYTLQCREGTASVPTKLYRVRQILSSPLLGLSTQDDDKHAKRGVSSIRSGLLRHDLHLTIFPSSFMLWFHHLGRWAHGALAAATLSVRNKAPQVDGNVNLLFLVELVRLR